MEASLSFVKNVPGAPFKHLEPQLLVTSVHVAPTRMRLRAHLVPVAHLVNTKMKKGARSVMCAQLERAQPCWDRYPYQIVFAKLD
mmetsp:Transcript_54519/g.86670  ORF Transcript_54519/g.86670 Transcript_54519/m.86670 type:complete len:85 (+) Transcript_54519:754-1008(+)